MPGTGTCHRSPARPCQESLNGDRRDAAVVRSTCDPHPTPADSERALPRHVEREPRRADLSKLGRVSALSDPPRASDQAVWVAVHRLLPDDEPLPPRPSDTEAQHLGGDALSQRHLCAVVQPVSRTSGTPVSAAVLRRRDRMRLAPARIMSVCRPESRPRRVSSGASRLDVEQLPRDGACSAGDNAHSAGRAPWLLRTPPGRRPRRISVIRSRRARDTSFLSTAQCLAPGRGRASRFRRRPGSARRAGERGGRRGVRRR